MVEGDPHNFNRRVHLIADSQGVPKIYKPRTTFWEHMFLDKTSSFRSFLRKSVTPELDGTLGHIAVTNGIDGTTGVTSVFSRTPATINPDWLFKYGVLLAFCSSFGITDLHKHNALTHGLGIQIVDIECVFWNLVLPSETLLLPMNQKDLPRTVLGDMGLQALNQLSASSVAQILVGVDHFFDSLLICRSTLSNYLMGLGSLVNKPIRILANTTETYNRFLKAPHSDHLFFTEEIEQLRRKDVPYFFGHIGCRKIYFFSKPGFPTEVLSQHGPLLKKTQRAFCPPHQLFTFERLASLRKSVVAEVVARLLDLKSGRFKSNHLQLYVENGYIKILSKSYSIQVKANRG